MEEWIQGRMDTGKNGYREEWIDGWKNGQMEEWIDERMDRQKNGQMKNEQMKE